MVCREIKGNTLCSPSSDDSNQPVNGLSSQALDPDIPNLVFQLEGNYNKYMNRLAETGKFGGVKLKFADLDIKFTLCTW